MELSTVMFLCKFSSVWFGSVQSLSRVRLYETLWIATHQASLSITNSRSSSKLTSIESAMPSSHLILCRPLLLLPPILPSIRVFSNESTLHEVAQVLEFQLQHQSFQWMFRTGSLYDWWFDLLAKDSPCEGTLKCLQHHSSKAPILWHSAFFIVRLLHHITSLLEKP